jgi:hypothetical protein
LLFRETAKQAKQAAISRNILLDFTSVSQKISLKQITKRFAKQQNTEPLQNGSKICREAAVDPHYQTRVFDETADFCVEKKRNMQKGWPFHKTFRLFHIHVFRETSKTKCFAK